MKITDFLGSEYLLILIIGLMIGLLLAQNYYCSREFNTLRIDCLKKLNPEMEPKLNFTQFSNFDSSAPDAVNNGQNNYTDSDNDR